MKGIVGTPGHIESRPAFMELARGRYQPNYNTRFMELRSHCIELGLTLERAKYGYTIFTPDTGPAGADMRNLDEVEQEMLNWM